MNIQIPQIYNDLTREQRKELCYILLTSINEENSLDSDIPFYIIKLLLLHLPKRTQQKVLNEVPFSTLWQYAEPFLSIEKLYHFPDITKMIAPAPRLANITIKQFSVADSIYYRLHLSQFKDETLLRQLTASLYCFKNKNFDILELPQVAEQTDKEDIKTAYEVAFAYTCCREYIISKFPKVFSSPNPSQREEKPVFRKEAAYTPFSKIISVMAMDQYQPLGNWHQCNATRIYDFFEVMTESMIQIEKNNNLKK